MFASSIVTGLIFLFDADNIETEKQNAQNMARSLCYQKGIIDVGCGSGALSMKLGYNGGVNFANDPLVVANVDKDTDINNAFPNFYQVDINSYPLPFDDLSFDVAFCSHVLEHIPNWEFAMSEMNRIADNIILVLPYPSSPSGHLSPVHVHHFTMVDMQNIINLFPKTLIYC